MRRLLSRRPGFSAALLATLALGIGAPTAVFSVVSAVLLRPLPYPEPDRVVRFRIESRRGTRAFSFDAIPATTALDWGARSSTLASIALFNDRALTLSTPEGPFRLTGVTATPNLFELLGVAPLAGRTFEGTADAHQIVLSFRTWQRFFAAGRAVVGTPITLDGEAYRVAGVMPADFGFPTPETAFWVPQQLDANGTRGMLLPAIARLRPGATLPAVLSEGRTLLAEMESSPREMSLQVHTLQDQLVGGVRRLLWILMAAVSFVSIIATVNIALLLLVRGAAREREMSIRLALGASRGQLVRQLFAEAAALALAGASAGLLLAWGLLTLLVRLAPASMPRLHEVSLDAYVLAFALALTAVTTMVFGVLSAGRTLAIDPVRALGASGSESRLIAAATPHRRLRLLASGELALTMVLLVGAGLLLRSFAALALVDQGFEASRRALAFQVSLPVARYPTPEARLAFHQRLLQRLREIDGVDVAGLAITMPNRQPSGRFGYDPDGPRHLPPLAEHVADVHSASEGFFEAMGMPLVAGRTFRIDDGPGSEPVMIISERLARLHFPDADPIGRMLYSGTGDRRVVGVVRDVRPASTERESSPTAYIPLRQDLGTLQWFASAHVVVRGRQPSALPATMRALVLSLDSEMPPFNVRTLSDEVATLVAGPRFSASVLVVFACVALALAAVGVYGVMAYAAAQRTREIGVRVALGATRAQVLRLMIRDGSSVVLAGLVAGSIAAAWLAQTLTGLLHDVQPADPVTLVSVAALLSATGLFAAYLPARRATRVSAVEALRNE